MYLILCGSSVSFMGNDVLSEKSPLFGRRTNQINLNCFVSSVGKWRGTDPRTKEETDIDVVGLDISSKKAVLGECKFKNEEAGKEVYDALRSRDGLIDKRYKAVQYVIFSLSGFSSWLVNESKNDKELLLVSLKDMYNTI